MTTKWWSFRQAAQFTCAHAPLNDLVEASHFLQRHIKNGDIKTRRSGGGTEIDHSEWVWDSNTHTLFVEDGDIGAHGVECERKSVERLCRGARPAHRPRGTGYASVDAPLVKKMHQLIQNGEANSVNHAAELVADSAVGGATWESKVRRLRGRYNDTYGE